MFPENWMWSPQFRFPFSGSVTQDILPDASWFFGAIKPSAGVGSLEKEIFEVASYGKQLGLIMDVLMPLIGEPESAKSKISKAELKKLYGRIEQLKKQRAADLEEAAVLLLKRIESTDREMLGRVLRRFGEQT